MSAVLIVERAGHIFEITITFPVFGTTGGWDVAAAGVLAVETQDLDEARQCIHDVFTPHRLVFHGREALDLHLEYASSPRLTLGRLTYGADVQVDVPPPESAYHLALPLRGACTIGQGGDQAGIAAGESAAMMCPDRPLAVHWSPSSGA
jgi:hypothetical protein